MTDDRQAKRLQRFRELAVERMERASLLWLDIEQGSDEARVALLRDLHTHKGDSSISGFASIASLTHALESAIPFMLRSGAPSPEHGDLFFEVVDVMGAIALESPSQEIPHAAAELIARLEALGSGDDAEMPKGATAPQRGSPASQPPAPTPTTEALGPQNGPRAPSVKAGDSAKGKGVRVQSEQLDKMRTLAGELILAKGRIERTADRVRKERESARRDYGSVTEAELIRRMENSLSGLESILRTDIVHLTSLVDALHSLSGDVRMIPISDLFSRYPRHIRELSRKLGKNVEIKTNTHETARLDREVLHALEEPILHLISNAIDHGIESLEDREKAGKPQAGTITLSATLIGNTIEISVEDDGGGIHVQSVHDKALEMGILTEPTTDRNAILQCLLEPGMTTSKSLSEVSGRGIGMDVVASTVRSVNGHLQIRSTEGKGTTFVITVPLSAAIIMLLTFRVGRELYAIPAYSVVSIENAADLEYLESSVGEAIRFRDNTVPIVSLQAALGEASAGNSREKSRIIVASHGHTTLALADSYDHAQREAVLKPAGALLGEDRLIIAGSSLNTGEIALVLNLGALSGKRIERTTPETAATRHRALVVDDSPIIRELLADTLRSFGLDVVEAEDGADALQKFETSGTFHILVTDVDMPNIDGIDLLKAIRRKPGPRIPAIVVSTRGSDADKLAAMSAGADAYLVKTSFSKDGLWSLITQYLEA